MTKERKVSATWYIAATHYLTAGFVIPFLASLLIGLGLSTVPGMAVVWVQPVITAVATWFGVMYSARFLEKTYIIPNPDKVIQLATIYFVVLNVIYVGTSMSSVLFYFNVASAALGAIVFYLASKKFVKATSASLV